MKIDTKSIQSSNQLLNSNLSIVIAFVLNSIIFFSKIKIILLLLFLICKKTFLLNAVYAYKSIEHFKQY
jgi:hypothetical protein